MIVQKIKSFFEKYNISVKGKKLCVCLSGGADSVALLVSMCSLLKEEEFSLCAVHVNHHIRGDEADKDENFCRKLCKEKEINLNVVSVFAAEEAEKTGRGLEETARKLRYDAFSKLKEDEKIDLFLMAHHANDRGETIVFNILRGCGVSGIMGIPPVRDFYIRPLSECTREEILSFLSQNNHVFVQDSTNFDESYTRNYIRHTLFEDFKRVNPNFLSAILRLSRCAAQDEDYFSCELAKISKDTDLSTLHPALASRAICRWYEEQIPGEGLSAVHVHRIMSCLSCSEEKCIDVPFGIKAYVKDGKVCFSNGEAHIPEKTYLNLGINVFSSDCKVIFEEKYTEILKFSDNPLQIVLNRGKINGRLFMRPRIEGDFLFCRGVRRRVSRELINSKVPKHLRDILPIVCDDDGVVFVPYVGADDRVFLRGSVDDPITLTIDLNTKGNS